MDEVLAEIYSLYDELLPLAVKWGEAERLQSHLDRVRQVIRDAPIVPLAHTGVALHSILYDLQDFKSELRQRYWQAQASRPSLPS
ncbi:hypothetical protein [Deinococcus peraridilitoris]|uniref:Uncharacterized protein n=1 Tax=Deinococcus peraridilitoris (strain DSM 19664 / LMG 22246 / CIP 109416 / KR-200) TaxID=937777 RepID=L0A1S4_DEIPD|nr:hypothetical protein [Deinococcus peraridilitoris]AFZ67092.1 hypothetical protein Deipe_1551 [Deinococcus peraridilitoris DSM 19664]